MTWTGVVPSFPGVVLVTSNPPPAPTPLRDEIANGVGEKSSKSDEIKAQLMELLKSDPFTSHIAEQVFFPLPPLPLLLQPIVQYHVCNVQ
jgi:hypothetical protein